MCTLVRTRIILILILAFFSKIAHSQVTEVSLDSAKNICDKIVVKNGVRNTFFKYSSTDTIRKKECWKLTYKRHEKTLRTKKYFGWSVFKRYYFWIDKSNGRVLKRKTEKTLFSPPKPNY